MYVYIYMCIYVYIYMGVCMYIYMYTYTIHIFEPYLHCGMSRPLPASLRASRLASSNPDATFNAWTRNGTELLDTIGC